jgi:hypothetical protein
MTEYQKYLKSWTSERGITSFLGSDKPEFQRDWKQEKSAPARFGEEMGREDINRAGEAFKKPKPIERPTAENLIDALMSEDSAKADDLFKALSKSNASRADARYLEKVEKLRKLGNSEVVKKWVELFVKKLDERKIDHYDMSDELMGFNGFQLLPYSSSSLKARDIPGYEFDRFIKKYRENPSSVSFVDFPIDLAIDIAEDDYSRKIRRRIEDLKEKYRETLPKKKSGALTEKSYQLLQTSTQRFAEQAKKEIYPEGMR